MKRILLLLVAVFVLGMGVVPGEASARPVYCGDNERGLPVYTFVPVRPNANGEYVAKLRFGEIGSKRYNAGAPAIVVFKNFNGTWRYDGTLMGNWKDVSGDRVMNNILYAILNN